MRKILCLILCLVLLNGCGIDKKRPQEGMVVYTSFYAMYDFAKQIAGDKAEVKNLIPPGVHIHDWEPGPQDMAGLESADMLIYCSDRMERWVESIEDSLERHGVELVETADDILSRRALSDAHTWLNPDNAYLQMEEICEELCEHDIKNAGYYRENLKQCRERIAELKQAYTDAVKGFSSKDVVVTHGAYAYLCDAYGLEQIILEGNQSAGDPSPAKMAEVISIIRNQKIPCVFYAAPGSDKVAQAIAKECGIVALPLYSFEGDAQERDYFSVMEENLRMLEKGLGNTNEEGNIKG